MFWHRFNFRDPIKIKNLIVTFRNEFYRKLSIEPVTCCNRSSLEQELKFQFRDESNALSELAKHIKYKTTHVQKSFNEFIDAQHRTDAIWEELTEKLSE